MKIPKTAELSGLDIDRKRALSEKSSYIENILRHQLVAELSREAWRIAPLASLQVFNSEVDDSGFDLVLSFKGAIRHIQLKQAHDGRMPRDCSIRANFATIPGACVILMFHSIDDLRLTGFRFFGRRPTEPMPSIENLKTSKSSAKRDKDGTRKERLNYRNVPVRTFTDSLTSQDLFASLFPSEA